MREPDQTRNLNPIPEARVAMIMYGRIYAESGLGSMDFWDILSEDNKRRCRMVVEELSQRLSKTESHTEGSQNAKEKL